MSVSRRDLFRLSALAASALALPAHADIGHLKPMRLLILGGTGFIGPHQVRYALARGHHVTVFNRGRQKAGLARPRRGIARRSQPAISKRWKVATGTSASTIPPRCPFWVRDAARVLKGHVGQYVFISTISVYAANDKPADESAPLVAYEGKDPMAETIRSLNANPLALRPAESAERKGGADPVRRCRDHDHSSGPDRGAGRRDRPLHLLARAAVRAAATSGAGRRERPGAVHRRPRPGGMDRPPWPSSGPPARSTPRVPPARSRWTRC